MEIKFTTTDRVEGYRITEYLGVESTDFAVRVRATRKLMNNLREGIGGRDETHETSFDEAREKCVNLMEAKAVAACADAVVGISFNVLPAGDKSSQMLMMSGTLVSLQKVQSAPQAPPIPADTPTAGFEAVSSQPSNISVSSPVQIESTDVDTPISATPYSPTVLAENDVPASVRFHQAQKKQEQTAPEDLPLRVDPDSVRAAAEEALEEKAKRLEIKSQSAAAELARDESPIAEPVDRLELAASAFVRTVNDN